MPGGRRSRGQVALVHTSRQPIARCLARLGAGLLQRLVWGVSPTDPATFLAVAIGTLALAAAASLIPALRIARLNPARTLREE